jgi:glycosyltransferase involved in cell wall biosynthesis
MDTALQPLPTQGSDASASLRLFPVRELGAVIYENDKLTEAQIAVIIPLYNYESMITECLDSVAAQDLQKLSILVIDDASTDGGGERAAAILSRYESRFARAQVVRHSRNQGLSMARNSGMAWSREPYLFMLDADNRIKRSCLTKLLEALETSGAAFAYSQLRMFGEVDAIGLADVWDPARLRDGNYIDAMALLRRDALLAAGGYATLANDYGWEDYDLWCRFAELGYSGVFLPEILGDYRVHNSSMLRAQTTNYTETLMAELTIRHPSIFLTRSTTA